MQFKRLTSLVAIFTALILGTGFAPALAQDATPEPMPDGITPLVIDTDMTTDDFMAILYVLNQPGYALKAITVSGTGFATCDAGVQGALGMLALTETNNVPVACGSETPLQGENGPPAEWKTTTEMVDSLGFPAGGEPASEDAVTLFTNAVSTANEPVTVLALGPLTNIGAALDASPDLADNISMIYVMGGAVDVDGSFVSETNTSAEWNIYCDPLGARLTFESGAPITLIGLDATNDVPISPEFVDRLTTEGTSPEAAIVSTLLANNAESIAGGGYYFWDPLAAAVMINNDLVTLTERDVTVIDIPGDPDDGRTKPVANGSTIWVATDPDGAALEDALIAGWNGQ